MLVFCSKFIRRLACKNFIFKIWSKISRKARKLARQYVLTIIRYIVFPIISLAGSKMILKNPTGSSLWSEWNEKFYPKLIAKQSEKHWIVSYTLWSYRSKNLWALFLLPFILLLKATEEQEDAPTLESSLTYTLF